MGFNTYPGNPFPPDSERSGGAGEGYTLPTASAETLGGVKVGDNLTIADGVLSAPAPTPAYVLPTASDETLGGVKVGSGLSIEDGVLSVAGSGLQLYHETYTGTGTNAHVLSLIHTPVFITQVGRTDGKVVLSPFSPKSLTTRVDWLIPNTGNGTVSISEDNGVKITGVDAGQACNTEDVEYEVYYLA